MRHYHWPKASSLLLFAIVMLSAQPGWGAVDFVLPDVNGVKHKLSDYRGKWVVLNYWATWCPPCLEEIPELEKFHIRHKDKDALVVGVNLEEIDAASLRKFMGEYLINYPVLLGGLTETTPFGPVQGLPTTYLISPKGEVAINQLGGVTSAEIEKFIASQSAPPAKQRIAEIPWWMFWKRW